MQLVLVVCSFRDSIEGRERKRRGSPSISDPGTTGRRQERGGTAMAGQHFFASFHFFYMQVDRTQYTDDVDALRLENSGCCCSCHC